MDGQPYADGPEVTHASVWHQIQSEAAEAAAAKARRDQRKAAKG